LPGTSRRATASRPASPFVQVETDKVDLEVEAPASGVLSQVLVGVDEDAEVGATLGLIEPGA
jgi:2-oxoglutarate dehydrogenase E2 component (dihydrolipoamide succinyltransferase)